MPYTNTSVVYTLLISGAYIVGTRENGMLIENLILVCCIYTCGTPFSHLKDLLLVKLFWIVKRRLGIYFLTRKVVIINFTPVEMKLMRFNQRMDACNTPLMLAKCMPQSVYILTNKKEIVQHLWTRESLVYATSIGLV